MGLPIGVWYVFIFLVGLCVGSFLNVGNETLLVGAEDAKVQEAIDAIRGCCQTRRQFVSTVTSSVDALPVHAAIEVEVGGATVFVLPVERFERLGNDAGHRDADWERVPNRRWALAMFRAMRKSCNTDQAVSSGTRSMNSSNAQSA
jgi:uncharacterized protein YaaQ